MKNTDVKKTNNEPNKLFRVVLTCWDFNEPEPYTEGLGIVPLSLFEKKDEAVAAIEPCVKDELETLNGLKSNNPRAKEPIEDSEGNIVGYDYPFRSDEDEEHDSIIRFWDGDDYRNVTVYDVYELVFGPCGLVNSASWYRYRGYAILVDRDRKCFSVEAGPGTIPVNCESLKDALTLIDENLLIKEA